MKTINRIAASGMTAALVAICVSAAALGAWHTSEQRNESIAKALTGGNPQRAAPLIRRFGCGGCHTIPGIAGADGVPLCKLKSPDKRGFEMRYGRGVGRAGSDFMYTASASRSGCGSIAVLVTTSTMVEPTLSRVGVWPLVRTSAISALDQLPMRPGVMFGTKPVPSGSWPPANRVSGLMAPNKLREEWHSAQWPSASAR